MHMTIAAIITVSGIVLSPLVAIFLYRRSGSRERAKAFNDTCTRFRSSFSEAIAELTACQYDVHYIMSRASVGHDAATDEFRRQLPQGKLAAFDAAVKKYRALRNSNETGILQYYREQATGIPSKDHNSACSELLGAINEILNFAKPI
jgi:hypothetical protein